MATEKFSDAPLLKLREYLRGCIYKYVDHDLLRFEFDNATIQDAQDAGWLVMRPTNTPHHVVYTINTRSIG
jgi:hypothetical protein